MEGDFHFGHSESPKKKSPFLFRQGKDMKNKLGFTLIELLVVVLIIGILAAIALPRYTRAVEKAKISEAKINLKAIVNAAHLYALLNRENTNNIIDLEVDIQGEIVDSPALGKAILTKNFRYYIDECLGENEDSCLFTADNNANEENIYHIYFPGPNYDPDMSKKFICDDNNGGDICKKHGAVLDSDGIYYFE